MDNLSETRAPIQFAGVLAKAQRHMHQLRAKAESGESGAEEVLPVALAELQVTLEELRVAEEQLNHQHDEIVSIARAAEAERARYQELFDFAPDAYLDTSPEGVIREANLAAEELFAIPRRFLLGKPLATYVAEKDLPGFRRQLNQLTVGGRSVSLKGWEIVLRRRTNEHVAVEIAISPSQYSAHEIAGLRWLIRDITKRRQSDDYLKASEHRYRTLIETAPSSIINLSENGTIVQWNVEAENLYGWKAQEALGRDYLSLCIPTEMRQYVSKEIAEARKGGPARRFESHVRTSEGQNRILLCSALLMAGYPGQPPEVIKCGIDITERHEVAHHRLLVSEIEHRVKNNLATVLAIADQTAARSKSVGDFKEAFRGRVIALAHMHTLLAQSKSQGVALRQLIEQSLNPYVTDKGPKASIEGEPIMLTARAAQCFAIALHELATNAAKYGALKLQTGRVNVQWGVHPSTSILAQEGNGQEVLHLVWNETGGPPVEKPTHIGLGVDLTRQCIQYELRGKVDLSFEPAGANCEVSVPWSEDVGSLNAPASHSLSEHELALNQLDKRIDTSPEQYSSHTDQDILAGKRILMVEDTALVAREVQRMLQGMHCEVVGPVATLDEALHAVREKLFDAVLLDVNLNGLDVWPVADELLDRDIPFILTTGYACPDSLPPEFRHCAYLEKPFDQKQLRGRLDEVLMHHQQVHSAP